MKQIRKAKMGFSACIILISLLLLQSLVFAQQVNNGATVAIDPGCGNCRSIYNGAGAGIWIGTNSCGEWNSFLANLPGGVSANSCCTDNAATGCPSAPGGDRYWYNSCGVQQSILEVCSGDICIDSGNNRHRTGCSGAYPSGSCTYVDQSCGYPGHYCGQGAQGNVWYNPGCSDPTGCQSNYMTQDCMKGQYFCDSTPGNTFARFYGNGCYGAGAGCDFAFIENCPTSGTFCGGDGNVYTNAGCSSGACVATLTQTCGNGCSGGACNPSCTPNSYLSCSNGDVHSFNSCNVDEGVWEDCQSSCGGCQGYYCAGTYCQCTGICQ